MYHNLSSRTSRAIVTALVALCLCTSQAWAAKEKAPRYIVVAVANGGSIKGTIKASSKQDETLGEKTVDVTVKAGKTTATDLNF